MKPEVRIASFVCSDTLWEQMKKVQNSSEHRSIRDFMEAAIKAEIERVKNEQN